MHGGESPDPQTGEGSLPALHGDIEGKRKMTGKEVIDSFNNAWMALAKQYTDRPDESTRCAMNLIAKMIGEVKSQVNRPRKEGQITMDEWLAMLQEGI